MNNENEIIKENEVAGKAETEKKAETHTTEVKPQSKAEAMEKTAGDKLMLILGGAGIVIVVAAVVFLISMSFGKDKDKETTTQSIEGSTVGVVTDEIIINDAPVTEGIEAVTDVQIDTSCRDAVKVFTDCFIYGQTDSADKLLPDEAWNDLAQSVGVSKDEFITVVKSNFAVNSVASAIGEENVLACDVNSVLVIGEDSAGTIRTAIAQKHGIDQSSITDVYAVSIGMKYNVDGQTVSETDELFCVKIDGVWYLAQSDCLAVYYMLTETVG